MTSASATRQGVGKALGIEHQRTSANEHPWPQRRRSQKLRVPPFTPTHNEPFLEREAMTTLDWQITYKFMSSRRSLAIVDLSDRVRAQLLGELPAVIRYLEERRISPSLANRAHTVIKRRERKPPPKSSSVAPAAALDTLEQQLLASIERSR